MREKKKTSQSQESILSGKKVGAGLFCTGSRNFYLLIPPECSQKTEQVAVNESTLQKEQSIVTAKCHLQAFTFIHFADSSTLVSAFALYDCVQSLSISIGNTISRKQIFFDIFILKSFKFVLFLNAGLRNILLQQQGSRFLSQPCPYKPKLTK